MDSLVTARAEWMKASAVSRKAYEAHLDAIEALKATDNQYSKREATMAVLATKEAYEQAKALAIAARVRMTDLQAGIARAS